MTNKRRHFRSGMICSQQPRDDGHPGAMNRVRQVLPLEEHAPNPGPASDGWANDQRRPIFRSRSLQQREQFWVKLLGVSTPTFEREGDSHAIVIDALEWYVRLGNAAPLAHQDRPLLTHPARLFGECSFNHPLVLNGDFVLLLWAGPLVLNFAAGVALGVASPHCFRHQDSQVNKRQDRGVGRYHRERSLHGSPPFNKARGVLVGQLRRRSDAVLPKECEQITQSLARVPKGVWVCIARREVRFRPCLPARRFSGHRRRHFTVRVFGFLPSRQALAIRSFNSDAGRFPLPLPGRRVSVFDPIESGCSPGVDRSHARTVPNCALMSKINYAQQSESKAIYSPLSLYKLSVVVQTPLFTRVNSTCVPSNVPILKIGGSN